MGARLTATVSDADGALQAWLAPGASLPVVFATTTVRFTAGSTTYDLDLVLPDPVFEPVARPQPSGDQTIAPRP